nr:unnamed protein product [Callosobruchus analis]
MSSRTKKIMGMVKQQSCDSAVDLVDCIVEEDGVLSPISEIAEDATGCIANNDMDVLLDDSDISDNYQNHDARDSFVNGDNDSEGRSESVSDGVVNNIKTRKKARGLP